MRLQAIAAVVLMTSGAIRAADPVNRPEFVVPVFVDQNHENPVVFVQAEILAGKMLASAGAQMDWCNGVRSCLDKPGVIVITLANPGQSKFSAGALASARPYEGVHIELLYDRVKAAPRQTQPTLLAHLLVHEISHILQGASRHSVTGVMKANWNYTDCAAMLRAPLPFTAEDILLIHLGLEKRVSTYRSVASR
jgi:hypothetical protein